MDLALESSSNWEEWVQCDTKTVDAMHLEFALINVVLTSNDYPET